MVKARLLLVLIILLAAAGLAADVWMINAGWMGNEKGLLATAKGLTVLFFSLTLPPTLLAAAAMLWLSFFRIEEAADGRLIYNPDNFHWKLLKRFYSYTIIDWKEPINLCRAFWLTALMVFVGLMLALAILGGVATIMGLVWILCQVSFTEMAGFLTRPTTIIGAAFLAGFIMLMFFFGYQSRSRFWGTIVLEWLAYAFLLAIVTPTAYQMLANNLAFWPALWVVAVFWGEGVLVIAVMLLVGAALTISLLGVVRSARWFKNTIIGRYAVALKENLCPILTPDISVEVGEMG